MKLNAALITVIESDRVNIDSNNTQYVRLFEQEAIRAFTMWRKNGGALADIDIYAVCITENTISDNTKERFIELGVHYIEAYHSETETFDCGFYNKPLGCKYLEEQLNHDYLIHIDLDMYLLREPKLRWENSCMIYDPVQRLEERIHLNGAVIETYNTCLMVTERNTKLFAKWWDVLISMDTDYKKDPKKYHTNYSNLDYRKIEELSFDILSRMTPVYNIPNSMFGETYTPLKHMTNDELANVYFHHYHIYDNYGDYKWLEDIKEWNHLV